MSEASIPSGWRHVALGEVTEERTERVGRTAEPPPVLSSTKHLGLVLSDEYFLNRSIYSEDRSNYKRVSKNWFAYATNHLAEGSIGLQDKLDDACVSPIYCVFSCDKEVEPRYLYRLLKSPRLLSAYKRREQASVDRRGAVRYRDFARIPIILPPPREQRTIAEILDTLDEAIRSTERLIAKLKKAKQGVLRDLFTLGIGESGHLREASPGSGKFMKSSLGRIPRAWVVTQLGSLAKVRSGSTPPRSRVTRYYSDSGIPWVKTLDLNESTIWETEEHITVAAVRECSCPIIGPGTVLLAMYGGWMQIGRTALMGVAGSINQAISALELVVDDVNPRYLLIALQQGRPRWKGIGASTRKDPNITQEDVLSFTIPIPPPREQEMFVSIVQDHVLRIDREYAKLRKLRMLKEGVMDGLLRGCIRVDSGKELSS
jgi:type I restriction enzyme S subunit